MKTKNGLLGSLGLLLFAAALVFGISFAEPEEACAGGCMPFWLSANGLGMGSTCAAAKAACFGDAHSEVEDRCEAINRDLCDTGSITYSSCYQSGGQTKVDCYLPFRCDGGPLVPN